LAEYETIKLKDLFKGADISDDFPDIEVVLPEKVKLYRLNHQYPGIISMDVLFCDVKRKLEITIVHGFCFS
jgi:hypothetical protein